LAFSGDSRLLATAPQSDQDMTMRVWEIATGKELRRFTISDNTYPTCLALTPDGKHLVAAHNLPDNEGLEQTAPEAVCLRLWDMKTGQEVQRFSGSSDAYQLAISPDGKTLAAAVPGKLIVWELASGKERGRFAGHTDSVASLAFSPDGRL